MAAGRPPKLTEEMRTRFLEAISDGDTIRNSCAYAGFSTTAFYEWKQYIREGRRIGNRAELADFLDSYRETEAKAKHEAVQDVRRAGQGKQLLSRQTRTVTRTDGTVETTITETFVPAEWRASAWLLERRDPKEWGRRDRTPVDMVKEAERLASELGISVDELMSEAEALAQSEG